MIRRIYLSGQEILEARRIIQQKTGYYIKSRQILNQIFRRSSLAAENGWNSNEIFEFIGDQILGFYVVKFVSEKCGSLSFADDYTFRIRENRFTQIKQSLVSNERLATIIDEWDVAKYLCLSASDIRNEVIKEIKVRADLLEAVIGAIAVESNWDAQVLETAVSRALHMDEMITAMIENDNKVRCFDFDNAVTALKEMAEKGQCTMPIYEFAGPEIFGYDADGNPRWHCRCSMCNEITGFTKIVAASSKKDAKKAAAYLVLCEHLQMQNKYGPNDWYGDWIYKDGKLLPDR